MRKDPPGKKSSNRFFPKQKSWKRLNKKQLNQYEVNKKLYDSYIDVFMLPDLEVVAPSGYASKKRMTPVTISSPGPRTSFSNEVGQIGMENIENLLATNAAKDVKSKEIIKKSVTSAPAIQKSWKMFSQDTKNTETT